MKSKLRTKYIMSYITTYQYLESLIHRLKIMKYDIDARVVLFDDKSKKEILFENADKIYNDFHFEKLDANSLTFIFNKIEPDLRIGAFAFAYLRRADELEIRNEDR